MKMEIEIPDWAGNARLLILSGTECVAWKLPHEDFWNVKETRCDQCGLCCHDNPFTPYGTDDEGRCEKLVFDRGRWYCMARTAKPYNCMLDPPEDFEGCSITYRKTRA